MGDRNIIKLSQVGFIGNKKWDEKGRSEIVQIIISYNNSSVNSLQILYYENENFVLSDLFGKAGQSNFDVVKFNYPSEYITVVSGMYNTVCGSLSVKFSTNLGTYGPFGLTVNYANSRGITPLEYNFGFGEERAFGGFYGSIVDYDTITSIGAYVKLPTTFSFSKIKGMELLPASAGKEFDYLFKFVLIGDSGVGKSTFLLSFTSDKFDEQSPTIGVDLKVKYVRVGGKKLKLDIWDTAGQERFRTLTSSYYRGAQGIVMVYDVTRRYTFTNLSDIWAKDIAKYSTNQDCIKMLAGNKVDKEDDRVVSKKEGMEFARQYGCLFIECNAKTGVNVEQCFEQLILKIVETPSLLSEGSAGNKINIFEKKPPEFNASTGGCC